MNTTIIEKDLAAYADLGRGVLGQDGPTTESADFMKSWTAGETQIPCDLTGWDTAPAAHRNEARVVACMIGAGAAAYVQFTGEGIDKGFTVAASHIEINTRWCPKSAA